MLVPLAACCLLAAACAGTAVAQTLTFVAPGCSTVEVPGGASAVEVTAVGEAGHPGAGEPLLSPGGAGGDGDALDALVSVGAGQVLDVCVDQGGGAAGSPGSDSSASGSGGAGGGAAGVSLGSSFGKPLLIAAGGGGGGGCACLEWAGGDGGAAGKKGGYARGPYGRKEGRDLGGRLRAGTRASSEGPGQGAAGEPAVAFDGAGGGGGGGLVGGGGGRSESTVSDHGGGGGGAGGTDYCRRAVVSCTIERGVSSGPGEVVLTFADSALSRR